jgi:MYXO-CTERM domain-containing protein
MTTGGAIVCDGQYVEASDVGQCVTALNALLTTQISANVTAAGTSSCQGSACAGQEVAVSKVKCSASPGGKAGGTLWGIGAAMMGLIALARRRR